MATVRLWRQNGRYVRPTMDENISSVFREYDLYGQPDSIRKCSAIQATRSRKNRNMYSRRFKWSNTASVGKIPEKNKMLFKIHGNDGAICKIAHYEKK